LKLCPVCSTEYPDDIKFCQNDGATLRAAAPATNLVGQVIADRYHVVKKLGEGGMGQVYLAEHVKMGRRSAIKVMNPSLTHDPDAVARFNREASNASRITHPNVCAVYDFGETPDGLIYLAMEFVEGEPLTDLLGRDGALPLARAVRIFRQVADALQAAHDLGIVHRDLKPDNIMLAKGRDGADVVKVVDFGIAKAVGGDEAGQKVTKTGLVVGTPEFMSPEQLSGDKVDGRSDLYSLALVFFRMLTGKLPFEATTVQETMIKRLTDEPIKLAVARPDLAFPTGLQEVLDAALTRAPADRYQSVAKFAADVTAVVGTTLEGAALPATRADVESKTQLLEPPRAPARGGGGGSGSATKVMASVKKRPLVPILLGAIVVLGGGAAAAKMLMFGPKADGSAVRADTVNHQVANKVDSVGRPRNVTQPTSARPGEIRVTKRSGQDSTAGTPPGSRPGPDAAALTAALAALLDKIDDLSGDVLVDSGRAIFNAARSSAVKAEAAYTLAQVYVIKVRDLQKAHDWIASAVQLAPSTRKYTDLLSAVNNDMRRP
jgi:serine/threonine-protein kinase